MKERLSQAVESARENGRQADLSDVPLEQLPAYEETGERNTATPNVDDRTTPIVAPIPVRPGQSSSISPSVPAPAPPASTTITTNQFVAPDEPPPGYEEAQLTGVSDSLEESLRSQNT